MIECPCIVIRQKASRAMVRRRIDGWKQERRTRCQQCHTIDTYLSRRTPGRGEGCPGPLNASASSEKHRKSSSTPPFSSCLTQTHRSVNAQQLHPRIYLGPPQRQNVRQIIWGIPGVYLHPLSAGNISRCGGIVEDVNKRYRSS